MRIFRPPLPVLVEKRNGVPAKLTVNDCRSNIAEHRAVQSPIANRQSPILWAAGPWGSSGDWWTEDAWAREEWDAAVQNDEGVAFYRIYRDERSGAWFVEAEYD